MEDDKMSGAFITSGKLQTQFESESLKIRYRMEGLGVVGRTCGSQKKQGMTMWIGFSWLKIETSSEFLLREYSNVVSHNKI